MRRLAACLVLICSAAIAQADPDPEGKRLFDEGRDMLTAGKRAEACERFEASYAIDPAPGTALNLADCAAQRQDFARAHDLYRAAEIAYLRANQESRAQYARDRAAALPGLPARVDAPERVPVEREDAPPRHRTAKIVLGASGGVALLTLIAWIYDSQVNLKVYENQSMPAFDASGEFLRDDTRCGDEAFGNVTDFRASCRAHDRLLIEAPLFIASAATAIGIGVYLLTRDDEPSKKVAIVPALAPNSAGAALQIRW